MQKLSQNFYGDAATRQDRRGAVAGAGGEANIGGPCRWWRHLRPPAACCLPAACCGGSHFICLLIKSCDTYKCPSGVNTFACMSSASQPPLPPPSLHSPTLSSLPTHLHCLQYQWMSRTSENLRLNVQCTARPATCDSTSPLPLSIFLSPSLPLTSSLCHLGDRVENAPKICHFTACCLSPLAPLPITPSIPAHHPVWSLL